MFGHEGTIECVGDYETCYFLKLRRKDEVPEMPQGKFLRIEYEVTSAIDRLGTAPGAPRDLSLLSVKGVASVKSVKGVKRVRIALKSECREGTENEPY